MRRLSAFIVFTILVASPASAALQTGDVAVLPLPDRHEIRFTLITAGGYVGFDAGADWGVVAMQSRPPVTVTAFAIRDVADQGTPDSTNLAVRLLQPDDDKAKAVLDAGDREHASAAVSDYKGWTLDRMERPQGATPYTIIDARRAEGDVICEVRLAWPHLAAHATGYDATMTALFDHVLDSIAGGAGDYAGHPGEVVRHPTN